MSAAPSDAAVIAARRKSRRVALWLLGLLLLLAIAAGIAIAYQSWRLAAARREAAIGRAGGGDPDNGPRLLVEYGCANCHIVPGVSAPTGLVGPDLGETGHRPFIAGVIPNSGSNLVRWIVDPHAVDPRSAMPRTGITPAEARDVAAYLYALP